MPIDYTLLPSGPPNETGQHIVLKAPHQLADPGKLPYELALTSSPKMDGNRALAKEGFLWSPLGNVINSLEITRMLQPLLNFGMATGVVFDMELYDHAHMHHGATSGAVRAREGPISPTLKAYIIDMIRLDDYHGLVTPRPFAERYLDMLAAVKRLAKKCEHIEAVIQRPVFNASQVNALFEQDIGNRFEGSIIRSGEIEHHPNPKKRRGGWYKVGRATPTQAIMWKMKLYNTIDCRIIGVQQRMEVIAAGEPPRGVPCVGALNVEYRDEAGTVRTSHVSFGVGYSMMEREALWDQFCRNPDSLLGEWVEVLHMTHGAKGDGLRHGRLVRFRPDLRGQQL